MSESKRLLDAASRMIPGGVNSPVRAFRAVGGAPVFIARVEHLLGGFPRLVHRTVARTVDALLSPRSKTE